MVAQGHTAPKWNNENAIIKNRSGETQMRHNKFWRPSQKISMGKIIHSFHKDQLDA